MSVELIAISSFVIALLGGLAHFIRQTKLKECRICCIDSDCRDEDKAMELKIKHINELIERNEKKVDKHKTKLEVLRYKKELSSPKTPSSTNSNDDVFYEASTIVTEV